MNKPQLAPIPLTPAQQKRQNAGKLRKLPSIRTVPTELEREASRIREGILRLLAENGRLQITELCCALDAKRPKVRYALLELSGEGMIRCMEWKWWTLTEVDSQR